MLNFLLIGMIFFFIFAIISIYTKEAKIKFHIFFKPLSLLVLVFLYLILLLKTKNFSIFSISPLLALFCGFLGDIFMAEDEKLFFPGLFSFLIGHIFYVIGFSKFLDFHIFDLLWIIPVYAGTFSTLIFLQKYFKEEYKKRVAIPTIVYTFFLTSTLISGIPFSIKTGTLFPAIGGFLFIISDTILTIYIFIKRFKFGQTLILSTYYFSQLFLFFSFYKIYS